MRTGRWWPPGRWRTRSWSPRSRCDQLRPMVGRPVTLHTLEYFDGNPAYGQMVPRLVGFLTETDKRFFVKYISVQGIGIAKGLRSLVLPVGQIARQSSRATCGPCRNCRASAAGRPRRSSPNSAASWTSSPWPPAARPAGPEPESKVEAIGVLVSLGLQRPEALGPRRCRLRAPGREGHRRAARARGVSPGAGGTGDVTFSRQPPVAGTATGYSPRSGRQIIAHGVSRG